jgi:DNA-binding CsgD family transcriptional regulator
MGALVEREAELATIDSELDRAISGDGSIVLVEGEAGIGKTELLRAAAARALARGAGVMAARGSELEHEHAYGVVRQLLLPAYASMAVEAQAEVLAGVAGLAAPVLGLGGERETGEASTPDQGAVLHGLYWLAANMAARAPLLISLDDVQWADVPSLRFVAFLARRLEGERILLLLSVRAEDASAPTPALAQVAAEPLTRVLRPQPLSEVGITSVIGETLSGPIDAAFADACLKATGGVPFLVRELLKATQEDGLRPSAEAVAMIARLGPQTVTRSTMLRLARLGGVAVGAAQGVAVLGPRTSVSRLSRLIDVAEPQLVAALDALVGARILRAEGAPEFVHPLVRTSVYEDLPVYLRSDLHARAAALLAAEDDDPEEVAAHLLGAELSDDPRHAELLLAAARTALARGAPDAAVVYLRRALQAASSGEHRGQLLYELGHCELATRDPEGIAHLRAATETLSDPRSRARAALALADGLFYVADLEGSRAVLAAALEDLAGADDELALALESMAAHVGYGDPRFNHEVRTNLLRLRRLAEAMGPRARALNVFLALVASTSGVGVEETVTLVERGLDGGRLLELESSDSLAVAVAVNALVFVDELDRADRLATAMLDDARRRGLILGFIAGSAHRGLVALRMGALGRAEAETRAALELAEQQQVLFTIPFTLSYLGAAMHERGGAAEAGAMLEQVPLPPGFDQTLAGATFRQVRGRLRLANGDRAGGVSDLRAAGGALEAIFMRNPSVHSWRSELALAIAPEEPEEAAELVATELRDARVVGSCRATGIALRAAGLLKRGDDQVADLTEAVALLERSPARLEHARAVIELGAALRRANARSRAREPLRAGLELATRCSAAPLAERARSELLACGGRPRRTMITGRDALTPSEQRIAEYAARGDSNRDIAQALFITPKTVENHLGRIYKKLAINSRERLSAALSAERSAPLRLSARPPPPPGGGRPPARAQPPRG